MKEIKKGIFYKHISAEKFKTNLISINFLVPLSQDIDGLAIIPSILSCSCEKYPNRQQLLQKLELMYGAKITAMVRKIGNNLNIGLLATFIDEKIAAEKINIIDIMMEMLIRPKTQDGIFAQDIFENEKKKIIEKKEMQVNDKRTYASRRLIEIMFDGYDFSKNEYGKNISDITNKQLFDKYQNILKNSEIQIINIGADIKLPDFKDRIIEKTQDIKTTIKTDTVCEKMQTVQAKLSLGFETTVSPQNQDYPALMVANALFGGSVSSKLFNNVREKLSLCYYASSNIIKSQSAIIVNSGIENDKRDIAKNAILQQLCDICDGKITDEEFLSAKFAVLYSIKSTANDIFALENYHLSKTRDELDLQNLLEKVESITIKQVIDVSKKIQFKTEYFMEGNL